MTIGLKFLAALWLIVGTGVFAEAGDGPIAVALGICATLTLIACILHYLDHGA